MPEPARTPCGLVGVETVRHEADTLALGAGKDYPPLKIASRTECNFLVLSLPDSWLVEATLRDFATSDAGGVELPYPRATALRDASLFVGLTVFVE